PTVCCVRVGKPMRCVDEPVRSLNMLRLAVLASISVAAVSCSSDTARFQNPFKSQSSSSEVTGSDAQQKHSAIQSAPLPPPTASAPPTRPVVIGPSGGSRGMGSYEPGQAKNEGKSDVTGSVQQAAAAKPAWNWEGGTAITVQKGDTIDGLVARYGVPAA